MDVRDVAHRPAVVCAPDTPLRVVGELMRTNNVGSVLVVGELGLMGIATDRDIVLRGIASGLGPEAPVSSVMSLDIAFVYEDSDAFSAATLMASRGCRRLPVIGADDGIKGVISLDDLIVLFAEQVQRLARTVQKEGIGLPAM